MAESPLSDSELVRFIVRSHFRLRQIAQEKGTVNPQLAAWFDWDEKLFREAMKRKILPRVPEWVLEDVAKKAMEQLGT